MTQRCSCLALEDPNDEGSGDRGRPADEQSARAATSSARSVEFILTLQRVATAAARAT
jgi:hypothetical protein